MGWMQIPLWDREHPMPPVVAIVEPEPTTPMQEAVSRFAPSRCQDCGRKMTKAEKTLSIWGNCKRCENERIQDVCAG